jgi:hypothetical protein
MPVIRIFYDETLDPVMRSRRGEIQDKLEAMMREVLAADPAKCQLVMSAVMHATPKPVYVDLQFRANDHRTHEVVSEAMTRTAAAIVTATGTGIRIRAFDIDQTTLHALDREAGEAS